MKKTEPITHVYIGADKSIYWFSNQRKTMKVLSGIIIGDAVDIVIERLVPALS